MLRISKKAICLLPMVLLLAGAFGQESLHYTHADRYYHQGLELFEKANFVAAQQLFEKAAQAAGAHELHRRGEAEFYAALCAIELFNRDAEHLIRRFIDTYPDNQKVNQAHFELGALRYRERRYADAAHWFRQVDRHALSDEDRAELLFKLGYSLFMEDQVDEASRAFFEIMDTRNRYASPATYFYSHIAYTRRNYAVALRGFERLRDDETFSPLVPYYITQILFLQQEYQRVIDYAPGVLEQASTRRAPEIARLIGESYFRLRRYAEAVPYIERFMAGTQTLTREDNYLIGFVYFKTSRFQEAVQHLERVLTEEDALSQNASYHLADAYIRLGQRAKARQAFAMASRTGFDPALQQDALFNFAKITYELLYNPFNEAIEAFKRYLALFPGSPRADQAHSYLMLAYANTGNYKEALESLNRIQRKDASVRRAYQRVAFFRGLELFQNLNFAEAAQTLTLSLQHPEFDHSLAALALYWRGESHYRLGQYAQARADFGQFLLSPGSFDLPEYRLAHYNLGYAEFNLRNYEPAIVWFRKFVAQSRGQPNAMVGDALNRIGDSYFIQRQYWRALEFYERAISANTIDVDYAMFQRGIAFGLVDRPERKVEALTALIRQFPNSKLLDDAHFELAETHLGMHRIDEAVRHYQLIERTFPGSSFYVRALVQLGLISFNRDSLVSAKQYYKRVVEGFPNSPNAKNALIGLRNIYMDMGDMHSYFEYTATLGSLGNVSLAERDSLLFAASEKLYMGGNCAKAIESLNQYLREFPKGNFTIGAHYYLADCHNRSGNADKALEAYLQVIQRHKSPFTESALLAAARIYAARQRHQEALATFAQLETAAETRSNLLEARLGMLRASAQLGSHPGVVEVAARVLLTEQLPQEVEREARSLRANSLLEMKRLDDALREFAWLSTNLRTPEGARAKYLMARIHLEQGDLARAESVVFDFAQRNTTHRYWLAQSFILLADIYRQRNDFFQAKATLQSVIDGYDRTDDGVIDTASARLLDLVKAEKESQAGRARDTLQMNWPAR